MRTGNAPSSIVHFLLGSFCAANLSHGVKAETSTRHSAARLAKAGSTHQPAPRPRRGGREGTSAGPCEGQTWGQTELAWGEGGPHVMPRLPAWFLTSWRQRLAAYLRSHSNNYVTDDGNASWRAAYGPGIEYWAQPVIILFGRGNRKGKANRLSNQCCPIDPLMRFISRTHTAIDSYSPVTHWVNSARCEVLQ